MTLLWFPCPPLCLLLSLKSLGTDNSPLHYGLQKCNPQTRRCVVDIWLRVGSCGENAQGQSTRAERKGRAQGQSTRAEHKGRAQGQSTRAKHKGKASRAKRQGRASRQSTRAKRKGKASRYSARAKREGRGCALTVFFVGGWLLIRLFFVYLYGVTS